jgi:hypothetical protein
MNRISMIFFGAVAFSWFGFESAAAQMLERPQAGQKIVPQALVPAQPPVLPLPPGFVMQAPSSDEHRQAGAKTITANQPSRSNSSRPDETAKDSNQTKVAQVYRGAGYFDAALAEKLEPTLAKALGVSKSEQKQLRRTSQAASVNQDSVQSKDEENARKITQSGGL